MLPDKLFVRLAFYKCHHKILFLNHPKTFSEKIQWIKIYGHIDKYAKYVDKYDVRSYINDKIGEKYLMPLLGVWNDFNEIDFSKLPDQFVLQATHGSGYVYVCKDKTKIDTSVLRNTFNKWLSTNFYNVNREIQYKYCEPKIICTKYLSDGNGDLKDYKFFSFHGQPKIIQVDSERYVDHKRDLMSLNWEKLPVKLLYENSEIIQPKPKNFDEMQQIATKLSADFNFVRVDLYSVNNKVYFGELTFTPGDGMENFDPQRYDNELGKLLDLK